MISCRLKALNLSKPYNFLYNEADNSYSFATVNDVRYFVYFSDGSNYFPQYPDISSRVYLFGFLTQSKIVPADSRVRDTIIKIVIEYFKNNTHNILLYVCDTNNQQEIHRSRKFNSWYQMVPNSGIVKLDQVISFDNNNYISILYHEHNPYAAEINDAFTNLEKDLFK